MESTIGPFSVNAHTVLELSIKLEEPAYQEEDMKLELDSIAVEWQKET